MSIDFKEKRINYLNNWPNVEPFDIEKEYYILVDKVKKENGTIFVPFELKRNDDVLYNKTISFMIEAVDQLEKYPNFSYEFIFKAYNCFIDHFYSSKNISSINKKLCDNEWKKILDSQTKLLNAFEKLLSAIPVKACQYLYVRLCERSKDIKPYGRVTTDENGSSSSSSTKRKDIVDSIENKYGMDYTRYADTIRKASLLYRYLLKNSSILVDTTTYNITTEDRLHILVSGLLYTLRNDIMHGSSISITKSSKTTLGTYAMDYFAYLLLYYLLVLLIIDKFSVDYPSDIFDRLADNIDKNVQLYLQLFGREIER